MYSLEEIVVALGAESAAIMAPHQSEDYLYCKDSFGMPPEWIAIKNPFDNSTNNGKVYLSGKPYLAEHIDIEFEGHSISSIVIVPILKEQTVISTLEIIISSQDKSFSENVVEKAQQFADMLATEFK